MEKLHSLLNSYNMTTIIENPRSLASVLSETRAFHETPLDAPKCVRLITELLYLLTQGSTLMRSSCCRHHNLCADRHWTPGRISGQKF